MINVSVIIDYKRVSKCSISFSEPILPWSIYIRFLIAYLLLLPGKIDIYYKRV